MKFRDAYDDSLSLLLKLTTAADAAGKEDEAHLLRHVLEHRYFIMKAGQNHRFEDYFRGLDPARTSLVSDAFEQGADSTSRQAMDLLLRALDMSTDPVRRELLMVSIEMLNYIEATGQRAEFRDYLHTFYTSGPWTVASFNSHTEAEHWLRGLAEPPSWAAVLVGEALYEFHYTREHNHRILYRVDDIEKRLEEVVAGGAPPPEADVSTHEEARKWLAANPGALERFIRIAGEDHLAVYHHKIGHHSLHPIAATLKTWEEEKQRRAERKKNPAPAKPGEGSGE